MHCIDILTLRYDTNSHTMEPRSVACNSGIIYGSGILGSASKKLSYKYVLVTIFKLQRISASWSHTLIAR